jgi:PAS domain S-box-containing protein
VYAFSNDKTVPTSQQTTGDRERYFATIIQNINDIVVTTDLDFRICSWNKMAEQVYGYAEEAVTGKRFEEVVNFEFLHTTLSDSFQELHGKGTWTGEVAYTNKKGELIYFEHTVGFLIDDKGEKTGILAIGKDITLQKAEQEKLAQSEKFYRGLIADSLDGILLMDEQGILTYVSPSVKLILGFEPQETIGRSGFEYVHPEDRAIALEAFHLERADSSVMKYVVVRLQKKTGGWLWCMCRAHNLLSNSYVNAVAIYFHDDTLRKTATEALKQSEQRFRNLVSELQVGIILQNAEGTIMMSNDAMYKMLSLSEHDLLGKRIWDAFPDTVHEDLTPYSTNQRPSYLSIKTKKAISDVVMGVMHPKTGKYIWLLINAHPILDPEGNVQTVICSFTDITERKKLEQKLLSEQLVHQRLLTQATIDSQEKERREIGKELHDNIGQRLTTIKLYLDLAHASADETTSEMISLSQRNISDVINEIRSLCRSLIPSSLNDLGLVECINDLIISVSRAQAVHVDFYHSQFDESLLPENQKLMVFRIVQEQLNNIVKHSAATKVLINIYHKGAVMTLEINDNGKGFDTATVRRGLGLTNMKNRAELLGGNFTLISSPGKGTTVKVSISPDASALG